MDLLDVCRRALPGEGWQLYALRGESVGVLVEKGVGHPYTTLLGWRAPDEVEGLVLSGVTQGVEGVGEGRMVLGVLGEESVCVLEIPGRGVVQGESRGLLWAALRRALGREVPVEVDAGDLLARVLLTRVWEERRYAAALDPLVGLAAVLAVALRGGGEEDWASGECVAAVHERLSEEPEALWEVVKASEEGGEWMGAGMGLLVLSQTLASKEALLWGVAQVDEVLAQRVLGLLLARGWGDWDESNPGPR